jgi:hypothetical protein
MPGRVPAVWRNQDTGGGLMGGKGRVRSLGSRYVTGVSTMTDPASRPPDLLGGPDPDEAGTDLRGGPETETAQTDLLGGPQDAGPGADVLGGPDDAGPDADLLGGPEAQTDVLAARAGRGRRQ